MIVANFHLPARLRATVGQFVRAVCPPDVTELAIVDTLVDHVEMSLRCLPAHLRIGLVAGLGTLEFGAVAWWPGRGRAFSRLDAAQALAYYHTWRHSPIAPIRSLVSALKSLVVMGYFEHPAIKDRIHYHPETWIDEVRQRRLDTYGDDIRDHERELVAPNPLIKPSRLMRKVRHA